MTILDLYQGMHDQPDWYRDALCAQTDPDAFFPEQGGSIREAKRVCLDCPVRDACLQAALERHEEFGVWGGLSPRERKRLWPVEPSNLGRRPVALTSEQEQIVAAMFRAGATVNQISLELGVGHRAIDRCIARLNQNGAAA